MTAMLKTVAFALAIAWVFTDCGAATAKPFEVPTVTPPGITVQIVQRGFMGMQQDIIYADAQGMALYTYNPAPKLSSDSTLGALIDNERSKAVLEKYVPGLASNPAVGAARAQSLKAVKAFLPGMTDDKLKLIDADLAKIEVAVDPATAACSGECAVTWPPFVAAAGAKASGEWSLQALPDGRKQWAFRGTPLHRYAKDNESGQAKGLELNDAKWRAARFQAVAPFPRPPGIGFVELPDTAGYGLVDARNMTLYRFTGAPKSVKQICPTVTCVWRPVVAAEMAKPVGDFSVLARPDQTRQWAYKGAPLFSYAGDLEAGYAYGTGVHPQVEPALIVKHFIPSNVSIQLTANQGYVLADSKGMTLYHQDQQVQAPNGHGIRRGVSPRPAIGREIGTKMPACDAACRSVWRPLTVPAGATPSGFWEIMQREDGTRQWAYKGYALYTYAEDSKRGDLLGDDRYGFLVSDNPNERIDSVTPIADSRTRFPMAAYAVYWQHMHP